MVCVAYLIRFTLRPSAIPGGAEGTLLIQNVPSDLVHVATAGLIPAAEYVPIEWAAESCSHQPPDVQAVLRRLVDVCVALSSSPQALAAAVKWRQRHAPGVVEQFLQQ